MCGRPTDLDTPSPYCHILSYILLPPPPPPLTADVVNGRPLVTKCSGFFGCALIKIICVNLLQIGNEHRGRASKEYTEYLRRERRVRIFQH